MLRRLILADEFRFLGKGNARTAAGLVEQIEAGACGLSFMKTGAPRPPQSMLPESRR